MYRTLILAALAVGLTALPAQARPYLMLSSDDKGFEAMDLGGVRHNGLDSAEVTLISAPLAGAAYGGDKLAPLVERRVTVDCMARRWRVMSTVYADAHEAVLSSDGAAQDWRAFDDGDLVAPQVQDAGCLNRFTQQMVSRYLNLGEILTNYQRAWGKGAAEPLSEAQLVQQQFKNNH